MCEASIFFRSKDSLTGEKISIEVLPFIDEIVKSRNISGDLNWARAHLKKEWDEPNFLNNLELLRLYIKYRTKEVKGSKEKEKALKESLNELLIETKNPFFDIENLSSEIQATIVALRDIKIVDDMEEKYIKET